MRLIDADKIRYSDLSDGHVPEGVWCTWKDRIDAMPIIEAIPIEWIKNWFNPKYANTVYYSLLRGMIKDWEKENEID